MTVLLDPTSADRLAKLCGMFGSDHDGERASAAALADKLVRSLGLTWFEVVSGCKPSLLSREPRSETVAAMVECIFLYGEDLLTAWEEDFLRGVYGREHLTRKQLRRLNEIYAKVTQRKAW
jgi:hypothetical protein